MANEPNELADDDDDDPSGRPGACVAGITSLSKQGSTTLIRGEVGLKLSPRTMMTTMRRAEERSQTEYQIQNNDNIDVERTWPHNTRPWLTCSMLGGQGSSNWIGIHSQSSSVWSSSSSSRTEVYPAAHASVFVCVCMVFNAGGACSPVLFHGNNNMVSLGGMLVTTAMVTGSKTTTTTYLHGTGNHNQTSVLKSFRSNQKGIQAIAIY